MKDLIKFINKNIMDDSSSDIGDSSTEDITFKRIENGFEITAPTGKKFKLINKLPETTNGKPKTCKHLEKTGRFKGEPYCQVYKGICKCK